MSKEIFIKEYSDFVELSTWNLLISEIEGGGYSRLDYATDETIEIETPEMVKVAGDRSIRNGSVPLKFQSDDFEYNAKKFAEHSAAYDGVKKHTIIMVDFQKKDAQIVHQITLNLTHEEKGLVRGKYKITGELNILDLSDTSKYCSVNYNNYFGLALYADVVLCFSTFDDGGKDNGSNVLKWENRGRTGIFANAAAAAGTCPTIVNSAFGTTLKFDGVVFDGINDIMDLGDLEALNPNTSLTAFSLVKVDLEPNVAGFEPVISGSKWGLYASRPNDGGANDNAHIHCGVAIQSSDGVIKTAQESVQSTGTGKVKLLSVIWNGSAAEATRLQFKSEISGNPVATSCAFSSIYDHGEDNGLGSDAAVFGKAIHGFHYVTRRPLTNDAHNAIRAQILAKLAE